MLWYNWQKQVKIPKRKSEADCLATYEIESFEFLLAMIIWYDILFDVNSISKNLQSKVSRPKPKKELGT